MTLSQVTSGWSFVISACSARVGTFEGTGTDSMFGCRQRRRPLHGSVKADVNHTSVPTCCWSCGTNASGSERAADRHCLQAPSVILASRSDVARSEFPYEAASKIMCVSGKQPRHDERTCVPISAP